MKCLNFWLLIFALLFTVHLEQVFCQEPGEGEGEGEGEHGEGEGEHEEPDHSWDEWDHEHHCEPPNDHCHPTSVPTLVPSVSPTTPEPTFVYTIDFGDTVETKVYPLDGTEMDMYGSHTHIHHTTAVVGAYGAKDYGEKSGAVYIYSTNATSYPYYDDGSTPWYFVQKLHLEKWEEHCNKDGCEYKLDEHYSENSEFGYAAAVWNDTIIVGAHKHADAHDEGGAAFVFSRFESTGLWSQTSTLSVGDAHDYHYFGGAIAMYDTTCVIGAAGDDHGGTAAGAAYVFDYDEDYDSWVMVTKLTSEDAGQFDNFASSLAIYKSLIVVGASGDEEAGADAGAAYIFIHWGSWQQQAKVTPYESSNNDDASYANFKFGHSVGIYDRTVVVGAYYAHGHWDNSGAAYIYDQDSSGSWYLQAKIIAHDGMTEDKFGWSVAIYKDTVVIGAWGEQGKEEHEGPEGHRMLEVNGQRVLQGGGPEHGENCGPNSPPDCQQYQGHYSYRGASNGAAYVFARSGTTWRQEFKLLPNGTSAYDAFGYAVDIHENVLFIGAYMADGVEENTGAAYIYAPPTMSPSTSKSKEQTYYAITGEVELDALLAVCLILVPAAIAGVWYYTQYKKKQANNDRLPVSTDSQHGSVAPWSMHGAFDDSSRGEGSRSVPTRSPLRGPPVARGL
mmetsp:Transcript_1151/g.1864  ORF Transcript_1151/g.1864 Transcript_1151/m.1864 type:complete len:670 (-) Transcript_1151:153-2162(-)|eukprot:CAMPEP_0185025096 /NCGR_PEP_ID=MMETSP1103-20130426/8184_1 /TAXON_ID=36769 /ORGANISM="Paraphysomonas bandaiensis, Strain Caron Lab Isolate" /LENGTH=669 /DNA_ID=CAMNT_0027558219 /DNA_START=35 /DNA_END=2044 /DNA_ORIENTATION=-